MIIYTLTALTDLKYRLGERPTPKDGYPIKQGGSIRITDEGLRLLHITNSAGKDTLDSKAFRLDRASQ